MKFRVAAMALSLLLSGCSLTVGPTTTVAPTTTAAPSASVGMTEAEVTTNHPPTTTPTSGSPTGPEWEALARSVVFIYVDDCGGYSWTGSGTIVLDGGYVLTNAHVVTDDAGNFCTPWILAANSSSDIPGRIANARVIPEAYDPDVDLAVLRLVDADGQPILAAGRSPVEITNPQLGLGDEIKVLGYPGLGGETITITGGEISGWLSDDGGDLYKSSARSGPGVSGGAVFDAVTGEYVGTPIAGTTDDVGEALVLIRPSSYALPLLQAAQQSDLPHAPTTTTTTTTTTTSPPILIRPAPTTTRASAPTVPVGLNEEAILTATYEWGPSDRAVILQELLGIPADGWYGNGTRATHAAELEARGLSTDGMPTPPTTTTTTTTTTTVPCVDVDAVVGTYPVGGDAPSGLVFDGTHIWVHNELDDTVSKLSPSDGALVGTYSTTSGSWPFRLGVARVPPGLMFDGTHIWVANDADDTVSKLRASDGVLIGTYPVGGTNPRGLVFDGTHIWTIKREINVSEQSLSKLRASDGALVGTYPSGRTSLWALVFDGTHIWTSNNYGSVSKLRASDGALIGTYPVGNQPRSLMFDGIHIWVANHADDTVSKLRASDGALIGTYPVGDHPRGLVSDGTHIWVANVGSGAAKPSYYEYTLSKLRASDGALVGTYPVGGAQPRSLMFDGTHIWFTHYDDSVSKLRVFDSPC